MKVVRPTQDSHTVLFIPRVYKLDGSVLELTNEASKEETTIEDHTITGTAYILGLNFTFAFTDGDKYSFKLYNNSGVIYRGRMIAMNQSNYEYDATENFIEYE